VAEAKTSASPPVAPSCPACARANPSRTAVSHPAAYATGLWRIAARNLLNPEMALLLTGAVSLSTYYLYYPLHHGAHFLILYYPLHHVDESSPTAPHCL
jgi:hypothetical protein